jgi:hypothetical protein
MEIIKKYALSKSQEEVIINKIESRDKAFELRDSLPVSRYGKKYTRLLFTEKAKE